MQLEEELDRFLCDFGYQVVDLKIDTGNRSSVFRLFVDRVDAERVTIADCASIVPQVTLFLEQLGVYKDRSRLEVSSAGLDRLLKRNRDFERYLGSEVKVTYFADGHRNIVKGELDSFSDDVLIVIPTEGKGGGESVRVDRESLDKVRLVPQVSFGGGKK